MAVQFRLQILFYAKKGSLHFLVGLSCPYCRPESEGDGQHGVLGLLLHLDDSAGPGLSPKRTRTIPSVPRSSHKDPTIASRLEALLG